MKFKSETVASSAYIFHDGDYYRILDKEKILLLLDEIKHNII